MMILFKKRTSILLLIVILNVAGCLAYQDDNKSNNSLVFQNVNVINPIKGMLQNMTVVVEGNKIIDVGSAKKILAPKNATIINGAGKFLIPGLWDMHVHLTYTPELETSMFPLFIANGITSVRDTGGKIEKVLYWRKKSELEKTKSPRVFVAGPLLDGIPSYAPNMAVGLQSDEDARYAVDFLAENKVDFIKVYEMLSPDSFMAIMDRAKFHNLPVDGHVPLSVSVTEASNAGLRSMEHLRNLQLSCSSESETLENERTEFMLRESHKMTGNSLRRAVHEMQNDRSVKSYDPIACTEIMKLLAANRTAQVPTLTLLTLSENRFFEDAS